MDDNSINRTSQYFESSSTTDQILSFDHVQETSVSMNDRIQSINSSCRNRQAPIIEDFIIIWLDLNSNQFDEQTQSNITNLRSVVNSVQIFNDIDECSNYITEIKNDKCFLIISGLLNQLIVHLISEMPHILEVYVFQCENQTEHESFIRECKTIKGTFASINSLCDALKTAVTRFEKNLIPISVISSSAMTNIDELEPSFMYSQLLKEIFLESEYEENDKINFIKFCRLLYNCNWHQLSVIDEFERNYTPHMPIWWYTRGCFIYAMLNKALRTQNVQLLMKMGFFVRDLHRQIEILHHQANYSFPFIVYRGQGLKYAELKKIQTSINGLLSFNSFLSTSTDREVAYLYADSAVQNSDLIGVLFRIEINSSIPTVPFTSLDNISYFGETEKEILFSMHTVFRITSVEQFKNQLWQIKCILIDNNDQQLKLLTENMRQVTQGPTWLHRIAQLMYYMGEFDRAKEIFLSFLQTTSQDNRILLADIHHQLGYIYEKDDNLATAFSHYQQSFDIISSDLSPNNQRFAIAYNALGTVYQKQGNIEKALIYFQKALDIDKNALEIDPVKVATRYNSIGLLQKEQGKFDEALKNFEHALEIYLIHLPPRHPSLATIYNNIGLVHRAMGENAKAVIFYEKTLDIRQRTLPPNHPLLAQIHANIGCVLDDLQRVYEAIEHLKQAADITRITFGANHLHTQAYETLINRLQSKLLVSDSSNKLK